MIKKYKPTTTKELEKLLETVEDLSLIDTSLITTMSCLFCCSPRTNFSGIETWDVSNVVDMSSMFANSFFDEDISCWNTSKVIDMSNMFSESNFNQDISSWNTSNVENMTGMFFDSPFNQNISSWNVKKVKEAEDMFFKSPFNKKLSALSKQNPVFKHKSYLGVGYI